MTLKPKFSPNAFDEIINSAAEVTNLFTKNAFQLYFVGGIVRDLLLGIRSDINGTLYYKFLRINEYPRNHPSSLPLCAYGVGQKALNTAKSGAVIKCQLASHYGKYRP